jgi:predicted dehydrogenase
VAEKIKVGVIGVGQIGKHHLSGYEKMSDVEIVAVSDVNEAEAERVAKQYGIGQTFTNFRDLLAVPEIQTVDVCLHNNFHAPMTIAALEAGKNVYCEKPMAGTYADALSMYEAAQRTGRKLSIQMANVFATETKAAKRLIDDGHLGKLYYGRSFGHRRRGRPFVDGYGTPTFVQSKNSAGGALFDMGVYHISAMLHLLGNPEVETISGKTHQELDMYEDRRASSGYDVEELGLGFVRLSGGITMSIEESWALQYDGSETSRVHGSKGGVKLDPLTYFTTISDMEMSGTFGLDALEFRLHSTQPDYEAYDSPQRYWIAMNQGRVNDIDTATLALKTALISEGIYLSNRIGREVTPDEVREHSKSTAIKL